MTPPETPASPATPDTSSPDEPSTPDPAASSAAQALALLNDNTKNSTRRTHDTLDLGKLSPEKLATIAIFTQQQVQGYTETELARALGHTPSWVSERLSGLKQELLAQTGRLRPLTQTEHDSLHDSIVEHGVQQPITIAQVNGRLDLIDGHNRYLISDNLGRLDQLPWTYIGELDEHDAYRLAITLNAARRQLTPEEKRVLIDAELMRDPARSDRSIAATCGVTGNTVTLRRHKLTDDQRILDQHNQPPDIDPLLNLGTAPNGPHARPDLYPKARVGRDGRRLTDARQAPAAPTARAHVAQPHPVLEATIVPPTAPAFRAQPCPACGTTLTVIDGKLRCAA